MLGRPNSAGEHRGRLVGCAETETGKVIGRCSLPCVSAFQIRRHSANVDQVHLPPVPAVRGVHNYLLSVRATSRCRVASPGACVLRRRMKLGRYGARLRLPVDDFDSAKDAEAVRALAKLFPQAAPQPSYIFTGVGEAAGGFMLSRLFTQWGKDLSWRRNSALTWDDIRTHNLIFLGSARYNPHLRSLPVEQAFLVDGGGVTNVRPAPGEPPKYQRVYSKDEEREILEDYAVVSRLPGLNGPATSLCSGPARPRVPWPPSSTPRRHRISTIFAARPVKTDNCRDTSKL